MEKTARGHVEVLEKAKQECVHDDDLLCRERLAEASAANNIVYYLAEDLARDSLYALPYQARLEDHMDKIKELLDAMDKPENSGNRFYSLASINRYFLLDTYGYAALVLEARKPNPDYSKIKKLTNQFRKVVEHLEEELSHQRPLLRMDLAQLRVARAHYASARDLAGE